jgi:ClpP class serine protease
MLCEYPLIYKDNFSLIGDVGAVWSKLWYHRFAEKYNIKQEFVFAGENKVKFNPFEEIKPES